MSYTFDATISFNPEECTFEFPNNSEIRVTDPDEVVYTFSLEYHDLGIRYNTNTARIEFGVVTFVNPQFSLLVNSRTDSFQISGSQPVFVIGTDDIRDIRGMEATITVILAVRPVRLVAKAGYLTFTSYGEEPTTPGEYEGMIIEQN